MFILFLAIMNNDAISQRFQERKIPRVWAKTFLDGDGRILRFLLASLPYPPTYFPKQSCLLFLSPSLSVMVKFFDCWAIFQCLSIDSSVSSWSSSGPKKENWRATAVFPVSGEWTLPSAFLPSSSPPLCPNFPLTKLSGVTAHPLPPFHLPLLGDG